MVAGRLGELTSTAEEFHQGLQDSALSANAQATAAENTQTAELGARVGARIVQARTQARRSRAEIEASYRATVLKIEASSLLCRVRLMPGYLRARLQLMGAELAQAGTLDRLYRLATAGYRAAGTRAGNEAVRVGAQRAREYRQHKINRDDSALDGDLTDRRCEAEAEAAEAVASAYRDELIKVANEQALEGARQRSTDDEVVRQIGTDGRTGLSGTYDAAVESLSSLRRQSLANARELRDSLVQGVDRSLAATIRRLTSHGRTQGRKLRQQGGRARRASRVARSPRLPPATSRSRASRRPPRKACAAPRAEEMEWALPRRRSPTPVSSSTKA